MASYDGRDYPDALPRHSVSAGASQVAWLDRTQIIEMMTCAFAVRLTDALDATQPHVRIHDGRDLLG